MSVGTVTKFAQELRTATLVAKQFVQFHQDLPYFELADQLHNHLTRTCDFDISIADMVQSQVCYS